MFFAKCVSTKTIRLFTRDFYEVIVDEREASGQLLNLIRSEQTKRSPTVYVSLLEENTFVIPRHDSLL